MLPKYEEWMKVFPDLHSLAKASTRDVLLYWSGLGYNRRALYLQRLAQELVHGSGFIGEVVWPMTEKELRKLPGIGEYTARAILCFAFDEQIAVVDTNVRKVIITFLKGKALRAKGKEEKGKMDPGSESGMTKKILAMTKGEIQDIADQLLPDSRAYEWNQALMDYASANLRDYKIPIVKQSKFKDSDRFFRGLTIRILLKESEVSCEKLFQMILKTKKIGKKRYEKILINLKKDELVTVRKNIVMLLDR